MNCSFSGCQRKMRARGWCDPHYQQHRSGRPMRPLKDTQTPASRFTARVLVLKSGCWIWDRPGEDGYGLFGLGGREVPSHRFAYESRNGPVPVGMFIDHVCQVKSCVKPSHLRLATTKQNAENRSPVRNSLTGIRGVTIDKGKYRVQAMHQGKNYFGGLFADISQAERAAIALRNRLFTHNVDDRGGVR